MRFPIPTGTAEAYEILRQRMVQPDGGIGNAEGRGVLIRCGLARWAQMQVDSERLPPHPHPGAASSPSVVPLRPEVELAKLVAGLILSIRQEGMHA
jgi:hypothetical protein